MSGEELPPLPPAYAPFAPVLERLSIPLLRVLHGQLLQFEPLARSLDVEEFAPQGEFEGLGGLTRRGDMAHVVQSELLLRTEAPLEFLRRLAEGETLYHEKQYADPGRRTIHRAMLSVGPGMLGHGRMVALATLLFMARVAAARRAEFHWCFLPRADGAVWFDEVSVNTIKRFLRAASYREMDVAEMEAAQELWDKLVPDPADADTRRIDWVIGAAGGWSSAASPAAVDRAANALVFTLAPPVAGEPREGQILVRMNGAHRARAQLHFPEDRVCLSALESPFRPIAPAEAAARPPSTGTRERMTGWEPRWFIIPRVDIKAVRMPQGVLILYADKQGKFVRRYLLPVERDMHLAGIRINGGLLEVAVSVGGRTSSDLLAYRRWSLLPGDDSRLLQNSDVWLKCHHLFRKRDPYALAPLTGGEHARFYSTSGRAFTLDLDRPSFTLEHKMPLTIGSDGNHRFVWEPDKALKLRVIDNLGKLSSAFAYGEAIDPAQLYGISYSQNDRALALSLLPNQWVIPLGADSPAQVLETAPHERVLAVSSSASGLSVRLWSDVRLGGDGSFRAFRVLNGKRMSHRPVLWLGKDPHAIVEVRIDCEGGIWALRVDESSLPTELVRYGFNKRKSTYDCVRHDLVSLLDGADALPGHYGDA